MSQSWFRQACSISPLRVLMLRVCVSFCKERNFSLGRTPLNDRWLPNVSSEAINIIFFPQPVPWISTPPPKKKKTLKLCSVPNPIMNALKSSSVIARHCTLQAGPLKGKQQQGFQHFKAEKYDLLAGWGWDGGDVCWWCSAVYDPPHETMQLQCSHKPQYKAGHWPPAIC